MDYQIVISGTIGGWWDGCSADYVRYTLNKNKGKDVHVGFCSLGGYVKDGLEMHQAFKDHGRVHAHAFGMNASISTIAMLGCASIDIVKGSFFLIHNVSVWIDKWESANKEALDKMIEELRNKREDLKNFDDVLASMYADKTGKTIEVCRAQMKKGNWMTAQQAVDFGLVDSIREDGAAEEQARKYADNFINYYETTFKDAGIPPLPQPQERGNLSDVVDEDGYPTQGFLQKTWQGLKNLLRNNHAENLIQNGMGKIFNSILKLLDIKELANDEKGNVVLTQEQAERIDGKLHGQAQTIEQLNKTVAENNATIDGLNKRNAKLLEEAEAKDNQIKELKGGAGDKTDDEPADRDGSFNPVDLFNSVKDI